MSTIQHIYAAHPPSRIAQLETQRMATRILSEAGMIADQWDRLMAGVENRIIERILLFPVAKSIPSS